MKRRPVKPTDQLGRGMRVHCSQHLWEGEEDIGICRVVRVIRGFGRGTWVTDVKRECDGSEFRIFPMLGDQMIAIV